MVKRVITVGLLISSLTLSFVIGWMVAPKGLSPLTSKSTKAELEKHFGQPLNETTVVVTPEFVVLFRGYSNGKDWAIDLYLKESTSYTRQSGGAGGAPAAE